MNDHRRSSSATVVSALAARDALALAEAVSRTLPVTHAVARRLLPAAEVEPLLHLLYRELWDEPSVSEPLEGWVRRRSYELALGSLRASGTPPASPSVRALEPDLPEQPHAYMDTTERLLAELDGPDLVVLLRAHDQGIPAQQQHEGAPAALVRSLLGLGQSDDELSADDAWDERIGDWLLGLVPEEVGEALERQAREEPARDAFVRALRRGRRRLEGLPPTPDLAARAVAVILAETTHAARPAVTAQDPGEVAGAGDLTLHSVLGADLDDDLPDDWAEVDLPPEPRSDLYPEVDSDEDGGDDDTDATWAWAGAGAGDEGHDDTDGVAPTRPPRRLLRRAVRLVLGAVLLALGVGVGLLVGQFIAGAIA